MTERKLTPWFPGTVKPARSGVYERRNGQGCRWYSMWASGRWWGNWATVARASNRWEYTGFSGVLQWRGLAAKP